MNIAVTGANSKQDRHNKKTVMLSADQFYSGRNPVKPAALVLILLAGASCATFGNKINPARVDQLKEGQSTRKEAIKLLGPPTTASESGDTTILVWMHAHEGPLGHRETTIIQLIFDGSGRLAKKATFGTTAKY